MGLVCNHCAPSRAPNERVCMSLSIDDLPSKTVVTQHGVITVRALEHNRISLGGDLLTVNNVPVRGRIFFGLGSDGKWSVQLGQNGNLWHCWDRSDRTAGTRDRELSSGARDKLSQFVINLANTEGTVDALMLAQSSVTNAIDQLQDACEKKRAAVQAAADAETAFNEAEYRLACARKELAELNGAASTPSSTS